MSLNFKAQTVERIKLSTLEEGQTVVGKFLKVKTRPLIDRETGEIRNIKEYVFHKHKEGNEFTEQKFLFIGDAGLNMAWYDAEVEPNQIFRVTKQPKKDLDDGNSVNQYLIETV